MAREKINYLENSSRLLYRFPGVKYESFYKKVKVGVPDVLTKDALFETSIKPIGSFMLANEGLSNFVASLSMFVLDYYLK